MVNRKDLELRLDGLAMYDLSDAVDGLSEQAAYQLLLLYKRGTIEVRIRVPKWLRFMYTTVRGG